jgi:hypothetical protein
MAWVWGCRLENNSSCWKDHDCCGSLSRKSYKTKEEAERAGRRHEYQTGHKVSVWSIGRKRWK